MKNLYIDFDGVVLDTIAVTYKILKEMGVNTKENDKVAPFYQNLNWKHILKISPELNDGIECIRKITKKQSNIIAIYVFVVHWRRAEHAYEQQTVTICMQILT